MKDSYKLYVFGLLKTSFGKLPRHAKFHLWQFQQESTLHLLQRHFQPPNLRNSMEQLNCFSWNGIKNVELSLHSVQAFLQLNPIEASRMIWMESANQHTQSNVVHSKHVSSY